MFFISQFLSHQQQLIYSVCSWEKVWNWLWFQWFSFIRWRRQVQKTFKNLIILTSQQNFSFLQIFVVYVVVFFWNSKRNCCCFGISWSFLEIKYSSERWKWISEYFRQLSNTTRQICTDHYLLFRKTICRAWQLKLMTLDAIILESVHTDHHYYYS